MHPRPAQHPPSLAPPPFRRSRRAVNPDRDHSDEASAGDGRDETEVAAGLERQVQGFAPAATERA
jgi:hypothetical protein